MQWAVKAYGHAETYFNVSNYKEQNIAIEVHCIGDQSFGWIFSQATKGYI